MAVAAKSASVMCQNLNRSLTNIGENWRMVVCEKPKNKKRAQSCACNFYEGINLTLSVVVSLVSLSLLFDLLFMPR